MSKDIFREDFGHPSEAQTAKVKEIKAKAKELYELIDETGLAETEIDAGSLNVAKQSLETAVMFAVKGVTKTA